MLEAQIEQDIKTALLARDKARTEVLRGLKSAILNEKIAKGVRETGLGDEAVLAVISKEVKKRAESAELYRKAGAEDRAIAELQEKAIIEAYLPQQLSDEALSEVVQATLQELGDGVQMGQAIGAVRQKVGATADGGRIAAIVKQQLAK